MTAPALTIRPVTRGWVVCLTDGRVIAVYRGVFAKRLALRYLQRCTRTTREPGIWPAGRSRR
jgi:hypothetical protein